MFNESSQDDSFMMINIVLLGKSSVGKTALIYRFINEKYPEEHDPTDEDHYYTRKTIEKLEFKLDILDTGGIEDYKNYLDKWIEFGSCFILVYSIDDANSFKELKANCELIFQIKKNEIFSIILVGNKCDLENERKITEQEGKKYAEKKNMLFLETSALQIINVKEVFDTVLDNYLKKNGEIKEEKSWCPCF